MGLSLGKVKGRKGGNHLGKKAGRQKTQNKRMSFSQLEV